jgi:hypothetical protein
MQFIIGQRVLAKIFRINHACNIHNGVRACNWKTPKEVLSGSFISHLSEFTLLVAQHMVLMHEDMVVQRYLDGKLILMSGYTTVIFHDRQLSHCTF